jgi:hypothetical protein
LADGIANAHCARACFDALDWLAALGPVYLREFGTLCIAPAFAGVTRWVTPMLTLAIDEIRAVPRALTGDDQDQVRARTMRLIHLKASEHYRRL